MGLILAWMYSTPKSDELFQILNLIEKDLNLKGLEPHWSNTTIAMAVKFQNLKKSEQTKEVVVQENTETGSNLIEERQQKRQKVLEQFL